MGLPGGWRGMVAMVRCKGWCGCGHDKQSHGNQTAQDVRPTPRNQSKPQNRTAPVSPKDQKATRSASRM